MAKIVLYRKGIKSLLSLPATEAEIARRARNIAAAAGPGMRVEVDRTPHRARAAVITDTTEAVRAEATDRALTRAIDAGRG